ncbi:hypothetical protein [Acinetobacter seifertii]|uniref:hypothetical protein n=1 Tax=Acinetobacter seifertii TaxID=1530123 RepID=UPI003213828D
MKTGKQILEGLFDDQCAAAHDPHHPVNDQLRASLLWKKHLLELIQIPRHQLKSDDSYVLVSDIPEYFKAQFEQYFLGQKLLQHVDRPEESRLGSKHLDSFIAYLKDHPSYQSQQRGQV